MSSNIDRISCNSRQQPQQLLYMHNWWRHGFMRTYIAVVESGIAQSLPEHPKRENIFAVSTTFGDAYLFQVCAVHFRPLTPTSCFVTWRHVTMLAGAVADGAWELGERDSLGMRVIVRETTRKRKHTQTFTKRNTETRKQHWPCTTFTSDLVSLVHVYLIACVLVSGH